jgi:hypothetical protein
VLDRPLGLAQSEPHEVLVAWEEAHGCTTSPRPAQRSAASFAMCAPMNPLAPVTQAVTTYVAPGCLSVRTLRWAP